MADVELPDWFDDPAASGWDMKTALERTILHLQKTAGRLDSPVDTAQVALVRHLCAAVAVTPDDSRLAKEYRNALAELIGDGGARDDDDWEKAAREEYGSSTPPG